MGSYPTRAGRLAGGVRGLPLLICAKKAVGKTTWFFAKCSVGDQVFMILSPAGRFATGPLPPGVFAARALAAVMRPLLDFFDMIFFLNVTYQLITGGIFACRQSLSNGVLPCVDRGCMIVADLAGPEFVEWGEAQRNPSRTPNRMAAKKPNGRKKEQKSQKNPQVTTCLSRLPRVAASKAGFCCLGARSNFRQRPEDC